MTDRVSIALAHVPGPMGLALLGVCVLLALYEAWVAFRRPRVPRPRRVGLALIGLRLLSILALLAVAFELTFRLESVVPAGRRLVVLIDDSASMGLGDAPTASAKPQRRIDRVTSAWRDAAAITSAWEQKGLLVDVRAFDLEQRPIDARPGTELHLESLGGASDLARALSSIESSDGPERTPVAGVVVISDGLVAPDLAAEGHLDAVVKDLGLPITAVAAGAPIIRDVTVEDVRAEMFAFVENVTEFEATIAAHGYEGERADVELLRDGRVVARQAITLRADGMPTGVRFEVAPDRIGQFVYEVAVVPREGEATTDNNRRAFVIKVLRDKVRVLHVAGRPDWDVRSLRTLLRRDPNVELLSYYILRGLDDIARDQAGADELSLIPFPTDELFKEELGSFDLVILHNFDAVRHQVGHYLDEIVRYVVDGGALVLIGGDLGLAEAGYSAQEIATILPVDTRVPAPLRKETFRPEVTDAGRRHPITAWLGESTGGWQHLPQLDDYNVLSIALQAEALAAAPLLVHPTARGAGGQLRPILAVAEPGKGRTLVLATGSSWRLGFAPDLALIDGARPYDLLWLGAVRWLLRDETSGRLNLETDRPRYRRGESVELRATTLTPSYAAEPDVQVTWEVTSLAREGEQRPQATAQGEWKTDGLGRATTRLTDLPIGAYEAIARRTGEQTMHEARRVFLVEPPSRELAQVDADPGTTRLQRIANVSGGTFVDLAAGDDLPRNVKVSDPFDRSEGATRVSAREDRPLWNGWWSLAVLLFAFGGEWLLRRRYGEV